MYHSIVNTKNGWWHF